MSCDSMLFGTMYSVDWYMPITKIYFNEEHLNSKFHFMSIMHTNNFTIDILKRKSLSLNYLKIKINTYPNLAYRNFKYRHVHETAVNGQNRICQNHNIWCIQWRNFARVTICRFSAERNSTKQRKWISLFSLQGRPPHSTSAAEMYNILHLRKIW